MRADELKALATLLPLLRTLTIRDVLNAGDDAIAAAGLNPWCVAEGRATGDEPAISPHKIETFAAALLAKAAQIEGEGK